GSPVGSPSLWGRPWPPRWGELCMAPKASHIRMMVRGTTNGSGSNKARVLLKDTIVRRKQHGLFGSGSKTRPERRTPQRGRIGPNHRADQLVGRIQGTVRRGSKRCPARQPERGSCHPPRGRPGG